MANGPRRCFAIKFKPSDDENKQHLGSDKPRTELPDPRNALQRLWDYMTMSGPERLFYYIRAAVTRSVNKLLGIKTPEE